MTNEELNRYQNGFKVAINFLYHHQKNAADKDKFEQFLSKNMDVEVVQEAISLRNNMQGGQSCPPGMCPDGTGGCVLCKFDVAFDGSYIA